MVKKGDTLIEVTLAVGIFSMIAIAVASLMNNGTTDAQLALETTLTREEIDAQADALRFVHSAYASNKESSSQPLTALWNEITKNAITEPTDAITQYAPTTCDEAMPDAVKDKAFVLNTRNLNQGKNAYKKLENFTPASTYPHLIFEGDDKNLLGDLGKTTLISAEGLYVIAVKDKNTTTMVGKENQSAYYDFYIRSCWYGVGDKTPSTISTVIRLHDASVIKDIVVNLNPAYDVKNAGDKIATITSDMPNIGARDYNLTNTGGAWVGYVCHEKPDIDKTYAGPILVSDVSADAVSYTSTWQGGTVDTSNGYFTIDGKTYYYGSHERWMEVSACNNSIISNDSKGYKTEMINERNTSGKTITERAARELLQKKKIIK